MSDWAPTAFSAALLALTLKAFANSSPGLRFGNPGTTDFHLCMTQL